MKTAIDLYSGIGGWTLGMKLSGIENVASFEWWHEANQTHNLNFSTNHKEIDIRKISVKDDLNFSKKIDFVVGSPPCTQFSFANKGGNGDIEDGLVDVFKFLEIVEHIKPKYWAMENVPRVAGILERELNEGSLSRFKHLVKVIKVVNTADYGVPQSRKRMIAGDFPIELFDSYRQSISQVTLGEVIDSLRTANITDPNYGYSIEASKITELENEVDLTTEEERINRDSKAYHPIYNNMAFPDGLNRPSRTVTATCTRVSRESIIVRSQSGFRRLNVRERGVIQGFPITYQFYGRTLNSKFKMIGNAVPPILTYYLFQSMLEIKASDILFPRESAYYHEQPKFKSYKSNLGAPVRKYPMNRKFQFAVPYLRYGSGVRFELSNNPKSEDLHWSFKFVFGNSKNIKNIPLNKQLKEALAPIVNTTQNEVFTECIDQISREYKGINSKKLQETWVSSEVSDQVFGFLDQVGDCVDKIMKEANFNNIDASLVETIVEERNRKLSENAQSIITGFYFLSSLNSKLFN
ncbi:MAG: DNA methyltransferase [Cytophagales bacterium CG12_big_fil_rev_8_21_14_0_65_40_12]|nr:MAG: DNA methyltransferase [Cytophagales bacterium CG12_big_fil_rev_8_21_14_0_65_40_12]PIW04354.1 MAG: DNA methyltransferase [Cytophagales bacterium CG17_big_fil_post_rev_8_21_14_2_50_40_13]